MKCLKEMLKELTFPCFKQEKQFCLKRNLKEL